MSKSEAPPTAPEALHAIVRYAREHPISTALLSIAVIAGGVAGYYGFAEMLTPIRSVFGGAIAGFGCWLLVMVGRVIGD